MRLGQFRLGHLRELGRVRNCVFGVGIAGMAISAVALASASVGTPPGSSGVASSGGRIESAFATIQSGIGDELPRSQVSTRHLANLDPQATAETIVAKNRGRTTAPGAATERASFDERFNSSYAARERFASFDERFAAASVDARERVPASVQTADWLASAQYRLETQEREEARLAMLRAVADAPAETQAQASAGATPSKPMRLAYAPVDVTPSDVAPREVAPGDALPAERSKRTAIYDISARVVYLPNGDKLEAHSGYGEHMDDLRSVRIRNLGVTPPNVYKLSLRESLFHGVRAIRMTPVAPHTMYARDGFLVHPYMLGPNGQSNGCVSIGDYAKFLNAFLNGEVERLVVVERLADPPPAEPAAGWLADRSKALFGYSQAAML